MDEKKQIDNEIVITPNEVKLNGKRVKWVKEIEQKKTSGTGYTEVRLTILARVKGIDFD